ncbi:hypothetical protein ABT56_17795 [Photobacterium aquae]|uniref:Uncharacterized protein n=1 Tax=Photobacterium aquae TaxID=1195763 RepID=A0A0J1GVS7_9GAMM|nr:hypothetical protein [Photobacterium aquae]KLV03823.1 hypothetical protein ABT56_17795 [Photobacterium aquae]
MSNKESYHAIDVPFEYRHTCWFCGEPYYDSYAFMPSPNYDGQEQPLLIPSCEECFGFCRQTRVSGIDLLRDKVKDALHKKYQKHLQIGVNWTKEELEDCEFEGKALEGFRESAWAMFEIAKGRVNYAGWPLTIDGQPVSALSQAFHVEFDGIIYTSLQRAVEQLAKAYAIPQPYLEAVIEVVGRQRLAYAIRFAKTTYGYSADEREASIASLKALVAEEQALAIQVAVPAKGIQASLDELEPLILHRTQIPVHAIQWILERGITNLAQLAECEDDCFDHFGKDSELVAYTYFTAMQVYLEQRDVDPEWAENVDPNRRWFEQLG